VRVEVEDQEPSHPIVGPATPDQLNGHALLVVEKLATDWGTERRATHQVVWFEIAR
jgi:hypothetical protein